MDFIDTSSFNLFLLLIFTLPGFFVLKGAGYKAENVHAHLMMSIFAGLILIALIELMEMGIRLFQEDYTLVIENPYAGALFFSMFAWPIGRAGKWLKPKVIYTLKCVQNYGNKLK